MKAMMDVDRLRMITKLGLAIGQLARLDVSDDGWHMSIVDNAHVAMLDLAVSTNAFSSYDGQDYCMGLDLERLDKALRLSPKLGNLDLEYEGGVLQLDDGATRWRLRPDVVEGAPPTQPALKFNASCAAPVHDLKLASKMATTLSGSIGLHLSGDTLVLRAAGNMSLDEAEMHLPVARSQGEATAQYPLDYWEPLIRALPQDTVDLHLSTDYPLSIDIVDIDKTIRGNYLIAPRIETEQGAQ